MLLFILAAGATTLIFTFFWVENAGLLAINSLKLKWSELCYCLVVDDAHDEEGWPIQLI